MMVRAIALVGASMLLTGCAATTMAPASTADAGSPPINYRSAVAASVTSTFVDPYSIRDASISAPLYASAVFDGVTPIPRKGWVVCVRANSKNRMGGYVGQQLTVFLFRGEAVYTSIGGPDYAGQVVDHCASAVFTDFDEIEAKA